MEEQRVADIIQIRRDTASNWTSTNPTLASGELGLETDTSKIKVGNGSTNWAGLSYWSLGTSGYAPLASPTFTGTLTAPTVNASTALQIGGAAITSTAAELNILDGCTATAADLNAIKKRPGLETIYVPAIGIYPNTTGGSSTITQVELGNGPEMRTLDFDPSTDEFAQFTVCFPKSWNEGTVTFQPFWTVTGTNTGTVAWGLRGVSIANDASNNTAFGSVGVTTAKAHSGTSNDLMVSAVSGAVTIASAAVDTMTYFELHRDVSADTQTGDARLLGIKLFFTTDASNDA